MKRLKFALLFPILLFASTIFAQNNLIPVNLTCEYYTNPAGIDVAHPRLSYNLKTFDDKARGIIQTACQIMVSCDPKFQRSKIVWDSKKVPGDRMAFITYDGKMLQSGQQYWWRVRIWDGHGTPTPWSKPAKWIMGVLNRFVDKN